MSARQRFMPTADGAVRLGVWQISPEGVEELLNLFERDASRTGDWDVYQDLLNARDGIIEPPVAALALLTDVFVKARAGR